MTFVETLQVVDLLGLRQAGLSNNYIDALTCRYEACNDCYHRYYPHNGTGAGDEVDRALNAALLAAGVSFSAEEYFYILLWWSW